MEPHTCLIHFVVDVDRHRRRRHSHTHTLPLGIGMCCRTKWKVWMHRNRKSSSSALFDYYPFKNVLCLFVLRRRWIETWDVIVSASNFFIDETLHGQLCTQQSQSRMRPSNRFHSRQNNVPPSSPSPIVKHLRGCPWDEMNLYDLLSVSVPSLLCLSC